MKIYIDIETYCSIDIRKTGAYKYVNDTSFEIILIGYAVDSGPVEVLAGADIKRFFESPELYLNVNAEIWAHNAVFERLAFKKNGLNFKNLNCSSVKAAYCGLPLGLGDLSKALRLEEKGKLKTGNALIKYFCTPCKPTKINGDRVRNMPEDNFEKWDRFKEYLINDVVSMREVVTTLEEYPLPHKEKDYYALDQIINSRGVLIDKELAKGAIEISEKYKSQNVKELKELTGLENPNSPAQLKKWLSSELGEEVTSIAKDVLQDLIKQAGAGAVQEVLKLRSKISKTSIKKYDAMLNSEDDGRCRGLFQFYGANRTGRWAGRLVQLQNLKRNYLGVLDQARELVKARDLNTLSLMFDDVADVVSQLVRTALIAPKGKTFIVADFSAIEARVTAWLAGETWRLEVFNDDGKIYEASAARMFGIPVNKIDKELRQKGKIAELALGYGGSVGALKQMGGESMGLDETEMRAIVNNWRKSNPAIKKLWGELEQSALIAFRNKGTLVKATCKNIWFFYNGEALEIKLPSGRSLFYWSPSLTINRFGKHAIKYQGVNQETKQWGYIDTYGGKLAENIIQAIARDLLAVSMVRLHDAGYYTVAHVHDEVVIEADEKDAEKNLNLVCSIMSLPTSWGEGLPLNADGFCTPYYKKD